MVVIRCGEVGRRVLRSACAAAAAFARGGDDLVMDEMLLTPGLIRDWTTALTGLDVLFVRVTCPLAVAEQRERARDHAVVGLARGHLPTVHEGVPYDLEVDTASGTPAELAGVVLRARGRVLP
ncbi:hypothetical protein ACFFSW_23775 [Saccharothrix longispora]|uniref:Chloramphenicol 3-O-phosphotransferase n=1 Tax=Saccharothrix longispora TaxID=33920 RepID=A0ABU1PQR7_9PSEU|nr:hypothetical protein [Saccharothrix longispora]MDR6592806.1 chloramphenicol 3-O-phosphotransferase [Saccharothrix longispora]